MTNQKRKSSIPLYEREDENRRNYRYQRNQQDRKMMKQLDNTLRSKNLTKLMTKSDDY